jgi:hypothetical protein
MPVPDPAPRPLRHASPPLGLVSAIYAVLFLAGLYPVTVFGGHPYFPGPWESAGTILAFFRTRPDAVRLCAALQFGAAIPLGIFSASIADRLRFLGAHVAGTSNIALAVCGELSWLNLLAPQFLPLVPLTRFPGFVWMIAVGVALPTTRAGARRQEAA